MGMYKRPDHQVAGHKAGDGKISPLIDDLGHYYKHLEENDRGSTELAFYQSMSSTNKVPDKIRSFFPHFHGTKLIPESNKSASNRFLVLQNLVWGYDSPSIMDIKIGSRTWYPQAPERYIQKCFKKDRETSSATVGFRLSGFKIHISKKDEYWNPETKSFQCISTEEIKSILKKFVSSNISADPVANVLDCDLDCVRASSVYGGSNGILAQLKELKAWFENQKIYHCYSTSVLMMYDKGTMEETKSKAAVKLIDFAHFVNSGVVIDHNFLGGLCSLIGFISEILTEHSQRLNKASLPCLNKKRNNHETCLPRSDNTTAETTN